MISRRLFGSSAKDIYLRELKELLMKNKDVPRVIVDIRAPSEQTSVGFPRASFEVHGTM
jgi:hypothetical protein